jgi:hypothetical protein
MPKSIKFFKDKKKALAYRNRQRKQNYDKSVKFGINKNQRWSAEDVAIIMKHGVNDIVIAKLIGRSVAAIFNKRNEVKYRAAESGAEPVQCLTNKGQNTGSPVGSKE